MAAGPPPSLNPAQREAVRQVEGPVLILAGAGTGKTRVITARIAHMVRERRIPPRHLLAITFTNKAANEMRERVAGTLRKEEARELTVSTFHSLCVRILRQSIERLGYKRNFSIYTGSDQLGLVRRLLRRLAAKDENPEPYAILAEVSRAKNQGIPEAAAGTTLAAEVYRAYQQELRSLNAVDFDDLLLLGVRVLERHEEVRLHWRDRFRYVMVDEFQDTNRLQMELLQHLVDERHNICVVGDDDQSIYAWRGAEISNILDFERFFPNPAVVVLEENYRCPTDVLALANSLIRHNAGRRAKRLWSRIEGPQPVRLVPMPGDGEEAGFVVDEIWSACNVDRQRYDDFAVLLRTNSQTRVFEQALRGRRIPYRVVGGQSFFDRREVRDLLAYFSVILNPDDDVNLLRVLNTPPRGIGSATVEGAIRRSAAAGGSVWATLGDDGFLEGLGMRGRAAVRSFRDLVEGYAGRFAEAGADAAAVAAQLVEELEYVDYLKRQCRTEDESQARAQGVAEVLQGLREHLRSEGGGLRGWLDAVALQGDREEEEDIREKRGVCLITLHAAKGLEFPHVYLAGLEEGILPHRRSLEEGNRDEERRLLYVGMTRAMQTLTLTYCQWRTRYGEKVPCRPSSFLKELDASCLEVCSYEELMRRPATEEEAADSFAAMRTFLQGLGTNGGTPPVDGVREAEP